MNNQKGFTLVEVIVVAVIVAVLAAVAIPLYNGYIHDSRYNVACNIGGSCASAAGASLQQDAMTADEIDALDVEYNENDAQQITLTGLDGVNNVINVPAKYSVTFTTTSAQAFYGDGDDQIEGETYVFSSE